MTAVCQTALLNLLIVRSKISKDSEEVSVILNTFVTVSFMQRETGLY